MKYRMAWTILLIAAMAFKYGALMDTSIQSYDFDPSLQKKIIGEKENVASNEVSSLLQDLLIQKFKHHLVEILLHPDQGVPLIYVEEYPATEGDTENSEYYNQLPELENHEKAELTEIPFKRSRYYRKYPWKRQNSREAYDAENRYMCQPSKEDVFRLLVALHEARQGNSRTVNFCNRRRAATAVFTNIRFLGRRK